MVDVKTIFTLVWDLGTLISTRLRAGRRDVHPGFRVGMDLAVWLGFLTATTLMAFACATWTAMEPEELNQAGLLGLTRASVFFTASET